MRLASTLALILVASPLAFAAFPGEKVEAGFVYVKPASGSAVIRESPDPKGKSLGSPPVGTRLVYRRVIDPGTGPTWYFVEHPGGKAGWLPAPDTSKTRPTTPPAAKPIKLVDSGVGLATPSSAQTAAARGLSPKAKAYAEGKSEKLDYKQTVDQFISLERAIDEYFSDPQDAEGNYPDVTVAGRKSKAEEFRGGLR